MEELGHFEKEQDAFWLRERFKKKKHKKKLTNVSLYVCMSAENSKMLVFVCFFMFFSNCRLRKKHKMLVFMEYVCKAKTNIC